MMKNLINITKNAFFIGLLLQVFATSGNAELGSGVKNYQCVGTFSYNRRIISGGPDNYVPQTPIVISMPCPASAVQPVCTCTEIYENTSDRFSVRITLKGKLRCVNYTESTEATNLVASAYDWSNLVSPTGCSAVVYEEITGSGGGDDL